MVRLSSGKISSPLLKLTGRFALIPSNSSFFDCLLNSSFYEPIYNIQAALENQAAKLKKAAMRYKTERDELKRWELVKHQQNIMPSDIIVYHRET